MRYNTFIKQTYIHVRTDFSMLNKTDIKQMFNNIAKNYDKLNNIMTFNQQLNIKKRAIANVSLQPNFKVLDVCTGTGDIAIYIAQNIIKEGKVIGVDFSENMLEIAKTKAKGTENIEFQLGDALNLPFEDGEFDACFISFGLRNLTDLKAGLSEIKRVTKKGGTVVNIDTGKPKGLIKIIHGIFFFKIIPIIGKLFNGNSAPYKYLPQSTQNFPSADELVEIFEELGLNNVKKFDFLFGAISQQLGEA